MLCLVNSHYICVLGNISNRVNRKVSVCFWKRSLQSPKSSVLHTEGCSSEKPGEVNHYVVTLSLNVMCRISSFSLIPPLASFQCLPVLVAKEKLIPQTFFILKEINYFASKSKLHAYLPVLPAGKEGFHFHFIPVQFSSDRNRSLQQIYYLQGISLFCI